MAAYNPSGAEAPGQRPGRDEGYLYWLGWLGHVGNSTFQTQDAHGVYRRIYLTASCQTRAARSCNATPARGRRSPDSTAAAAAAARRICP